MRVRFAPSPTGFLHIGNARTAVINHLVAQKENADLVIRIEDTDKERSSIESEQSIMEDLKWLGIKWTESPKLGGNFGPYRQTERFDIYKEYTEKLLQSGKAFKCFCTREEVEEDKNLAQKENRPFLDRCRDRSIEEQAKLEAEGKPFTIKFKVPVGETIEFDDQIKGKVSFKSEHIGGDFIIVRSDGFPVYNYIVIIDDTLMEISHVIRGEDHLSNTPKQILIARALGLPEPVYAHMPLLVGEDKKKLSKRHGITSVNIYRNEGYLPEALMNYLGMLGWASESGEEIFPEDELVKIFSVSNLGKSAAVFDFKKLRWMNGQYIKNMDISKLTDLFLPYIKESGFDVSAMEREKLETIISLIKGNCELLSDIGNFLGIFLNEVNEHDEKTAKLLEQDYSADIIKIAADMLAELDESNYAEKLIPGIKEKTENKGKKLFHPIRALITGAMNGPDLELALPLIGFEKIKKRIEFCRDTYLK